MIAMIPFSNVTEAPTKYTIPFEEFDKLKVKWPGD